MRYLAPFILLIIANNSFGQHPILRSLNVNDYLSGGIIINFTIAGGNTCNGIRLFHTTDTLNGFTQIATIPGICGNSETDTRYSINHYSPIEFDTNYYYIEFGGNGKSNVFNYFFIGDQKEIKWLIRNNILLIFEPENLNSFESVSLFNFNGKFLEKGVYSSKRWEIPIDIDRFKNYIVLVKPNNQATIPIKISIFK